MPAPAVQIEDTVGVIFDGDAYSVVTTGTEGSTTVTVAFIHQIGELYVVYCSPVDGTAFVTTATVVDAVNEA